MGGGGESVCLSLYSHHRNDFCIKVGSDESRFNVSLIVRDEVARQCPTDKHKLSKRKESRSNIEPRSFCLPA